MTSENFKLPNPHIQASVYYLNPKEGGRSTPVANGYRGQFYFKGYDWDASQELIGKALCNPGESVDVLIQFASAHNILTLSQGLKFMIREGNAVVGRGIITNLIDPDLINPTKEKNLYSLLDQILWTDWDPIGVNDIHDARDEYQSYVPAFYSLKKKNADQETITNYLMKIETEQMGLPGDIKNCKKIALRIMNA